MRAAYGGCDSVEGPRKCNDHSHSRGDEVVHCHWTHSGLKLQLGQLTQHTRHTNTAKKCTEQPKHA